MNISSKQCNTYQLYKFNRTVYCYIKYIVINTYTESVEYIVPGQLGSPSKTTIKNVRTALLCNSAHWMDLIYVTNNLDEMLTYLFVKEL